MISSINTGYFLITLACYVFGVLLRGRKQWILDAVEGCGYSRPYPIQRACLDPGLAGESIIAQAQTGSGKSLAFAIMMLERVDETIPVERMHGTQVICMAPTRELARMLYNDTLYPLLARNPAIRHRLLIPDDQNPREGHAVWSLQDPVAQQWGKGTVTKTYPHDSKDPTRDQVDIDLVDGGKCVKKAVGDGAVQAGSCDGGYPHIVVGTPGTIKSAIVGGEIGAYFVWLLFLCKLFMTA